ncbi:DUF2730 family protein [Aeromonas piscicola]|uniref:DUF2730 family protein n=1 Tax=Aeromonas piscicola TaxID=600645 RepID=UPI0005B3CBF9|nr:DUF2730 family protein [Aeromonas piscicola]
MNEPGLIVGSLLIGVALGVLFTSILRASQLKQLHRRVNELEERTLHLPDRDEWSAMRRDITEVTGAMRSISAKLEGVDRLVSLVVESKLN